MHHPDGSALLNQGFSLGFGLGFYGVIFRLKGLGLRIPSENAPSS